MNNKNKENRKQTERGQEITQELKQLVVWRLKAIPSDLKISIGGNQFSQKEALVHVKNEDEVGNEIAEIQIQFLRDLTSGKIYQNE